MIGEEISLELDGPLGQLVQGLRGLGLDDAAIGSIIVAGLVRSVRRDNCVDARRRMNAGHGYGRPAEPNHRPRYDKRRNIVRPAYLGHAQPLT